MYISISEEEEGVSCEIMVCRTFNSKLSFVLFFNFYWSIVDLQCCIRFRCVLFFQFFLCIKLSFFIAVHQLSLIAASRDYSSYLSTGSRAHTHTHTHTDSRAHRLQQLWHSGLVGLGHVGSSQTRDQSCVSCISRQILNQWATGEVPVLIYIGVQLIYNVVLVSGVKTDY